MQAKCFHAVQSFEVSKIGLGRENRRYYLISKWQMLHSKMWHKPTFHRKLYMSEILVHFKTAFLLITSQRALTNTDKVPKLLPLKIYLTEIVNKETVNHENVLCYIKNLRSNTAQKMKFSIKDFFSKCDQIRSLLRIWSHLLKKSFVENFIFCAV